MAGGRQWRRLTCGWLVLLAILLREGSCVCYFPGELQGVWETQVTSEGFQGVIGGRRGVAAASITYQNITIHNDVVQEWGVCHRRRDDTVILADSTGVSQCYKCVSLRLVAAQVLQVWTPGLQKCFTSEDTAFQTCPTPAQIAENRATLLMLYKSRSVWGEPEVRVVGCPFDGRYTFTYERAGGAGGSCSLPTSEMSNCPHGFGYNVTYRDCSFSAVPFSRGLQCLGSWPGEDGHNYLAVRDVSVSEDQPHLPRYRCGIFEEEVGTARVYLALSNDTTCTNDLQSARSGYETFTLTSVPAPPLPAVVSQARCTFPRSLQGHWHHTYLGSDTALFRDYINHKTYSVSCVQDMNDGERFIVYARTHCGDWSYNCFWLKRRSANILEHMLGLYPKETVDPSVCDMRNFGDRTAWITQGKSLLEEPTSCPIIGRYTGELPDASGICAELFSDCSAPNLMSFTVAECRNTSAVYEQREYQCLGQWTEDGRIYALTYRRDIRTYECFVGVIKSDGTVFIKEAESEAGCSRNVQPEVFGMKLQRKEICPDDALRPFSKTPQSSQRSVTTRPTPRPTKPWKPITGRPRARGSGGVGTTTSPSTSLLCLTLTITLIAATVRSLIGSP
ncbi:uncharacterized protein LOC127009040 isoform X3 [Eriocheir sinensis]|uniref:uncharacterized protein LOC127009040 isoform X3 n=1 Tax=Eriocheir sinensis TaxID=95602 RepID=UPI0021C7FC89|nr:uncharacterized protein LOC127009040 isoform X3 [Eriocheir sinensis]